MRLLLDIDVAGADLSPEYVVNMMRSGIVVAVGARALGQAFPRGTTASPQEKRAVWKKVEQAIKVTIVEVG